MDEHTRSVVAALVGGDAEARRLYQESPEFRHTLEVYARMSVLAVRAAVPEAREGVVARERLRRAAAVGPLQGIDRFAVSDTPDRREGSVRHSPDHNM